jgi:hypothetical protein
MEGRKVTDNPKPQYCNKTTTVQEHKTSHGHKEISGYYLTIPPKTVLP